MFLHIYIYQLEYLASVLNPKSVFEIRVVKLHCKICVLRGICLNLLLMFCCKNKNDCATLPTVIDTPNTPMRKDRKTCMCVLETAKLNAHVCAALNWISEIPLFSSDRKVTGSVHKTNSCNDFVLQLTTFTLRQHCVDQI